MIRFPDTPEQFYQQTQVCQFGLTEALGAGIAGLFGGGADILGGLGGLFGLGDAAAGAGAGAAGAGIADLVGPTAAGTAANFLGEGSFDALTAGAAAGTGADALGSAGAFLAAPGASLLDAAGAGIGGAAADAALSSAASSGLASGTGSIASASAPIDALLGATPTAGFGTTAISGAAPTTGSSALPSNVANANGSASVFETGTSPITNTGTNFAPPGASASSVSAPTGVAGSTDATSAAASGATGAQTAGGTAAKSTSITDLLSKLSPSNVASSAIDSLVKNPLPVALGAAGLGYNILEGQKQTANEKALSADAATATANSTNLVQQGEALTQYLQSGTLPPAYMTQVTQAIQNAKTAAISNAAAQGLPTDPTKNTALAATLASIDNQEPAMISQVASQLFNSGANLINAGQSAAGLSGQLYQALVSNDTTQAGNIGKAIATLASALNGKSTNSIGGITVSTGCWGGRLPPLLHDEAHHQAAVE